MGCRSGAAGQSQQSQSLSPQERSAGSHTAGAARKTLQGQMQYLQVSKLRRKMPRPVRHGLIKRTVRRLARPIPIRNVSKVLPPSIKALGSEGSAMIVLTSSDLLFVRCYAVEAAPVQ